MTKIKNTKKGMAKKTLSMSLVIAMLATSNVPVWAAEFSDGTDTNVATEAPAVDTADEFTDAAETETPAVDTTADADAATETSISNPKSTLALQESGWANKITVSGNLTDKDGHQINEFGYKWVVGGLTGNRAGVDYGWSTNGTVPAYSVTANDIGKSVELQIFEYSSTVIGNDSYVAKTNAVTVSKTNVDLNSRDSKLTVEIGGKEIQHVLTYTGKTQYYNELGGGARAYANFDNTTLSYADFDFTTTIKEGNGIDAGSVLQLRGALESKAAFLAAQNCTPLDAAELQLIIARLDSTQDEKIRGDLDRDLHLKIAQISDNPLILSVLNASAQITENMIVGIRSYLMQKNNDAPEIDSQHTRLVQAITNNDAPLAEKVMNEHMHTIEYLLNEITSDNLTISDNVQQP